MELGGSGPAPSSTCDPDFSDGFTITRGNHVVDEPKAAIRIVFRQRGRGVGLFCVGFPTSKLVPTAPWISVQIL